MTEITHIAIGAGRMGGAMIAGWVSGGTVAANNLLIADPFPGDQALSVISQGAKSLDVLAEDVDSAQYVLLAIKPQMFNQVAPTIAGHLPEGCVVVSVLAGTTLDALKTAFPKQKCVRAMPNTPASIGKGITGFVCGNSLSDDERNNVKALLSAGGKAVEVASENLIDSVTAISGSGPAYFFHMVEALTQAGINIGLAPQDAADFARETLIGAGALLEQSGQSATELREAVTSPNGTTQAALDVLMERLPDVIGDTAKAAFDRSVELGKG